MTFTEFLNIHGNSSDCKAIADMNKSFDHEVFSFNKFKDVYHEAVRKGLTPDNAAEVFMKRYNVDFDFNLDAESEGLTLTEWACKIDPWSIVNQAKNDTPKRQGTISFASPITEEDLKKYKMPYLVDGADDEDDV